MSEHSHRNNITWTSIILVAIILLIVLGMAGLSSPLIIGALGLLVSLALANW